MVTHYKHKEPLTVEAYNMELRKISGRKNKSTDLKQTLEGNGNPIKHKRRDKPLIRFEKAESSVNRKIGEPIVFTYIENSNHYKNGFKSKI